MRTIKQVLSERVVTSNARLLLVCTAILAFGIIVGSIIS